MKMVKEKSAVSTPDRNVPLVKDVPVTSPVRNNPQIWRMAEFLYSKFSDSQYDMGIWEKEKQDYKDYYYDTAAELLKKISNNDFTGQDNHRD